MGHAVGHVALGAHVNCVCVCHRVCHRVFSSTLQRYALVIGNGAYDRGLVLERAGACAVAVNARLTGLGFVTKLAKDLGRRDLKAVFDRFLDTLSPGCTAVVYFAGHGWQESDGADCFLLPCSFSGLGGVSQGVCH